MSPFYTVLQHLALALLKRYFVDELEKYHWTVNRVAVTEAHNP